MTLEESFYIGYITKTKGLKGEVQVYFEFDDYEDLELDSVFIEINKKLIPFFAASYKLHANSTGYFYFEDIDVIEKPRSCLKRSSTFLFQRSPRERMTNFTIQTSKDISHTTRSWVSLERSLKFMNILNSSSQWCPTSLERSCSHLMMT
jgi:16S rRNA processing protein RimM